MKNDQFYIDQILDAIRKIESYAEGIGKNEFLSDEKTQSAILLQLLLIGEISKKISENTRAKYDLPWKMIIGFRDRAIHNYFEMDIRVVWDTIQQDVPLLKKTLGKQK